MNKLSNFAAVLVLVAGPALANGKGHHHEPLVTNITNVTEVTEVNNFGVDNNEFHSSLASVAAADAIHCTTSSRKHQMGVGVGNSDGHNGFAAGYCNSIEIKGKPVMLGFKASTATDAKALYSVGLNWTF